MIIRSLVHNLPKDPGSPGWVLGWAVVQSAPGYLYVQGSSGR